MRSPPVSARRNSALLKVNPSTRRKVNPEQAPVFRGASKPSGRILHVTRAMFGLARGQFSPQRTRQVSSSNSTNRRRRTSRAIRASLTSYGATYFYTYSCTLICVSNEGQREHERTTLSRVPGSAGAAPSQPPALPARPVARASKPAHLQDPASSAGFQACAPSGAGSEACSTRPASSAGFQACAPPASSAGFQACAVLRSRLGGLLYPPGQ